MPKIKKIDNTKVGQVYESKGNLIISGWCTIVRDILENPMLEKYR